MKIVLSENLDKIVFLSPDWKHILYLKELILRQKVVFNVHVVADAVDDDADANVELDDDDAV